MSDQFPPQKQSNKNTTNSGSSLSLEEYKKALATLGEALAFAAAKEGQDEGVFKIARDACIQRFEYCIELSWKVSMKKLGSATKFAKPAVREMARADLIPSAEQWLDFIEARNSSSHSYDENVANKIYQQIKKFAVEAGDLTMKLESLS